MEGLHEQSGKAPPGRSHPASLPPSPRTWDESGLLSCPAPYVHGRKVGRGACLRSTKAVSRFRNAGMPVRFGPQAPFAVSIQQTLPIPTVSGGRNGPYGLAGMDAREISERLLRVFTKQTDATRCSGGSSEKFRVNMPDKALNQVREGDNKRGAGAVDP